MKKPQDREENRLAEIAKNLMAMPRKLREDSKRPIKRSKKKPAKKAG